MHTCKCDQYWNFFSESLLLAPMTEGRQGSPQLHTSELFRTWALVLLTCRYIHQRIRTATQILCSSSVNSRATYGQSSLRFDVSTDDVFRIDQWDAQKDWLTFHWVDRWEENEREHKWEEILGRHYCLHPFLQALEIPSARSLQTIITHSLLQWLIITFVSQDSVLEWKKPFCTIPRFSFQVFRCLHS